MQKRFFLIVLSWLVSLNIYSQKVNADVVLHIREAEDPIVIDGELNEITWAKADVTAPFTMVLPMDTSLSRAGTEVRMAYDDHSFYLAAICYDDEPGRNTVESLRRDFSFGNNDNFIAFIDPFDDQTNGFAFGVNAFGAQWDGMMYGGSGVNLSWDNKWYSKVKNYGDKWVFECRIPFKSIRYKKGITKWGINFSRHDLKLKEKSAWAPVPRQFATATLAYTGILHWDKPPPHAGTNISLIPYGMYGYSKDHEDNNNENHQWDAGMDAKLSVTSSVNLDLTLNPDFSQLEVDKQVTNLSRYELYFPERRQFFLENSDLFAGFGMAKIRPFFSRRIGFKSPIMFGARLSGKINKNWRIGLMNIQTNKVDSVGLPVQNYAVAAIQRQVFSRSNIAAVLINKESVNFNPEPEDSSEYSLYNRNIGLEYNLASSNNAWTGKFLYHRSFSPGKSGKQYTHASKLTYKVRKFMVRWHHEYVGENFNAETGYVPRLDYYNLQPYFRYFFFPSKSEKIVSHGPRAGTNYYTNSDFEKTDYKSYLGYSVDFYNKSFLHAWFDNHYVKLLDDYDPTNTDGLKLAEGSSYSWNAYGMFYRSGPSKKFTYEASAEYGGYYNGTKMSLGGELGYRFQPYVSIGADVAFEDIQLPEPYASKDLWLVSPRVDLTFTNTIFFTAFLQYNSQKDNLNINSRFQWRFKPASDFYIVYTENYFPGNMDVKNRALIFKLTYWYNI